MSVSEKVAEGLLSIGAVFLRPKDPFTWASGIKSPIYCDNRLILTAPQVRDVVEQAIADTVKSEFPECEVLMGTSTAELGGALGGVLGMVLCRHKTKHWYFKATEKGAFFKMKSVPFSIHPRKDAN